MLFNTVDYALFFALVFVTSWAAARWLRGWARIVLLLGASYWFYAHWNWRYLPLVFGVSTVDFLVARALSKRERPAARKALLCISLGTSLGLLAVFKYWNFGLDNVRLAWTTLTGHALGAPSEALRILLPPVGISFFTFVSLGYVIDVYRGRLAAHDSYLRYLLFVSFFPHLVAGPIVRARDLLPQLAAPPVLGRAESGEALFLVGVGLLKKVVLADQLALQLVDPVFAEPGAYSALEVLAGSYGYAIQIYCDFSGYTDIAVGSALLLGVRFPVNFDMPYRSTSVAEFWRRWHISLSNWLRDYLFAPLGGAVGSAAKTVRNLLLTMLLGGLWHGAAWTFVLWGLLHGLGLAATALWQRLRAQRRERAKARARQTTDDDLEAGLDGGAPEPGAAPAARSPSDEAMRTARKRRRRLVRQVVALGCGLLTFHYVCFGWIFFRAGSLERAKQVLARLATLTTHHPNLSPLVLALLGIGLASHFVPGRAYRWLRERFTALPAPLQGLLLFLVAVVLHEASAAKALPFVYFQF